MDVALQQLQAGEACKIILYPGKEPAPTTAPGLVEPEISLPVDGRDGEPDAGTEDHLPRPPKWTHR